MIVSAASRASAVARGPGPAADANTAKGTAVRDRGQDQAQVRTRTQLWTQLRDHPMDGSCWLEDAVTAFAYAIAFDHDHGNLHGNGFDHGYTYLHDGHFGSVYGSHGS